MSERAAILVVLAFALAFTFKRIWFPKDAPPKPPAPPAVDPPVAPDAGEGPE